MTISERWSTRQVVALTHISYTVASDENAPDGVEWQGINLDSGQLVDEAGVPITQLSQAIELNGIVIDNTAPQLMSFDKQDSAESVNDDEFVDYWVQ